MLTFFDIIKQPELRKDAETLLAQNPSNKKYQFSSIFPTLIRYRSLSSYAIDGILNDKLTLTAIGEFNDLFDGAIHRFGTDKEISLAAENRWESLEQLRIAARLPAELLNKESLVRPLKEYFKQESRSMFNFLSYLGTYVCCFSEKFDSTLMWSHYGDSSKGVCIAYDFNLLNKTNALANVIFPVSYSNQPLDLSNFLNDKMNSTYKYPYDTATLCAALNKAAVWDYENEWRLLFVTAASCECYLQRFAINLAIKPSAIYLGFHFLKSFFYYDYKNESELKLKNNNIM